MGTFLQQAALIRLTSSRDKGGVQKKEHRTKASLICGILISSISRRKSKMQRDDWIYTLSLWDLFTLPLCFCASFITVSGHHPASQGTSDFHLMPLRNPLLSFLEDFIKGGKKGQRETRERDLHMRSVILGF
jgi:hypothetical protein